MGKAIRIEIESRIPDRHLEKWANEARDYLGVQVTGIEEVKVYKISSSTAQAEEKLCAEVFCDPVLQNISFKDTQYKFSKGNPKFVAEISFRPGVTDNPARAAEEALALTGVESVVASGSLYFLFGEINQEGAQKIARDLLANDLIQKIDLWTYADFCALKRFDDVTLPKVSLSSIPAQVETVSLELPDVALESLSKEKLLALTLSEMHHIRDHFRTLQRDPTDVELEILAQSWSEHCKHKIFAATVDFNGTVINSLYKTYIKRATQEIKEERGIDWLISVFSDNAGIVRFDDNVDLCIKVETHNSPSALDPYGGALTGILGVNRDIMGAGLGARPIANTDVFCFAPPDMPRAGEEKFMPEGVKPPRRILEGVHKGVEDGGNKSGIPTVNGAFFFDRDYAGKPLVFVGTVGVMPPVLSNGRKSSEKNAKPQDRIFMVGGAIGADGIHGATFSSLEMDENAPATAVQIGDPITQKRVLDFLMEARDLDFYSSITDNGAGGLSSSVGEMAQATNGACIDLALCPTKYPGLKPWELMVSESQERMTVAVPLAKKTAFLDLAARRGVVATDIGVFNDDGFLTVLYDGKKVGALSLSFLHDSLPPMQLKAEWNEGKARTPWSSTTRLADKAENAPEKISAALLKILASPNVTSKEKWVRAYDHEVQAATHLKPFAGAGNDGPSDAGVIWLKPHGGMEKNGIAVGCGLAPRLSPFDPYLMAQYAVDEAVRNVVATGGDPDMLCLLDNFCWPDPVRDPYKMGQLVRTCEGLYDICKAYGAPLVSGKDSMKNDFRGKDKRGDNIQISVLPTLMVTAMARVEMGTTVGSAFKNVGDLVYLLGAKGSGLAGSEYAEFFPLLQVVASAEGEGILSETSPVVLTPSPRPSPAERERGIPSINLKQNIAIYRKIHTALGQHLFASLHDISDGGLLTAIAESAIGGRLGFHFFPDGSEDREARHARLVLASKNKDFGRRNECGVTQEMTDFFFNETAGRFVVSISRDKKAAFENMFDDFTLLGEVTEKDFVIAENDSLSLERLVNAWKKGF